MDEQRELRSRVVLVFDELEPTPEALRYSLELAQRLHLSVVLLMLPCDDAVDRLSIVPGRPGGLEATAEEVLAPCVLLARTAGVAVEAVLRTGDPSSELMKYLAETRPIHTIVWGGDQEAVRRHDRAQRSHWFVRMRDRVELPVVVPTLKP
jgi:nucleotide-binding universal stress UspA family protein